MLDPRRMWYVIAAVAVAAIWSELDAAGVQGGPCRARCHRCHARGPENADRDPDAQPVPGPAQPRLGGAGRRRGSIAFIASGGGASGSTAVLFFEGDIPDEDMAPARMSKIVAAYQRHVTEAQIHFGLPFIVVARPGVMGSSGFHLIGGLRDEGEVMNAAVDQLKQRFGYQRLALAGQSGGARIVAQLLVLGRRDIACAVMGSGAYGVPLAKRGGHISTNILGEPGRRYLVPLHRADRIASAPDRRAFVIGDPRDVRTPFPGQREWAEKMQALGHHAVLLEGTARGPEHHGLSATALQVAAMCASGRSDQEIAAQVAAERQPRR